MKIFYSLMVCLIFGCSVLLYGYENNPPKGEDEIQQLIARFTEAWNQHNPRAMSSFWLDNGNLITPWGKWVHGRDAIEKLYAHLVQGNLKNFTLQASVQDVRLITPDIAWVDVQGSINNQSFLGPDSMKNHVVILLIRKNGVWRFAAARPYLFINPPAFNR